MDENIQNSLDSIVDALEELSRLTNIPEWSYEREERIKKQKVIIKNLLEKLIK